MNSGDAASATPFAAQLPDDVPEGVLDALQRFFAVQAQGDRDTVAAFLSDVHTGFGSGPDEIVLNRERALDLIARQRAQVSDVKATDFTILTVQVLTPDLCILLAQGRYEVRVGGEVLELQVRMTFAMEQLSGEWKLAHQHISEPAREQEHGESYPLQRLYERNRELERLVRERTAELEQAVEALQRAATTDRLTALPNRAHLDELLSDDILRMRAGGAPTLLGIVDIDNFKQVNDQFGHVTGDAVLRDVAQVLRAELRASDVVGRWGGEEFLMLLHDTDADGVATVLQRVREVLAEHDFGIGRGITLSGGIAWYRQAETLDSWLSRADSLLYEAKDGGRDRILRDT